MSGVRYVDLGLGTHRAKCRIHPNFRLVLIAEDKVTKCFRLLKPLGENLLLICIVKKSMKS